MSKYQLGPHTLAIPMKLFKDNRTRVVNELNKKLNKNNKFIILVQGGDNISLYDTDVDYVFRQEAYFTYLFGVTEPGCYGAIDVETGNTTLFVPYLPDDYAIWMGKLHTLDDFQRKYEVDNVRYVNEIETYFREQEESLVILTLTGIDSDSGLTTQPATFPGIEKFTVNNDTLLPVVAECRVIKSQDEIEVLRYVAKVSSDAHKKVMKMVKPGVCEFQAEAAFLSHAYSVGGCRHCSYTCICGSGHNGSILHYGHAGAPNDRTIQNGDMCLFDMGGNYAGYAADITCSFPANGKFTDDQKIVYNAVLAARNAVLANAKDGVSWVDMHKLANRVMLGKLKDGNLLKGDVDEMMAAGINGVFQPHGLGHLIGLSVHDVGGYLDGHPSRPTEPGCEKLRTARVLLAGMYITVEPGCYFIDKLIDKALADPVQKNFLIPETIERFRKFGGVRIEDDVLILKDGCENFAIVPRTVEEIESWMQ